MAVKSFLARMVLRVLQHSSLLEAVNGRSECDAEKDVLKLYWWLSIVCRSFTMKPALIGRIQTLQLIEPEHSALRFKRSDYQVVRACRALG